MSPGEDRSRPRHEGGPDNNNSGEPSIADAAVGKWVIDEALRIAQARADRLALWAALGLKPRPRLGPEEMSRFCAWSAMLDKGAA